MKLLYHASVLKITLWFWKQVCFSHNKNNKCTNADIIYLQTIRRDSDTVRSILIIFRESLNISTAYIKT